MILGAGSSPKHVVGNTSKERSFSTSDTKSNQKGNQWSRITANTIILSRCVGMADEADSKSVVGNHVRVQVPLPALKERQSVALFFVFLHKLQENLSCDPGTWDSGEDAARIDFSNFAGLDETISFDDMLELEENY